MRLIHGLIDKTCEFCVERFVTEYDNYFSMAKISERKELFKNFPFCLEAIDVTLQQANRPSGNMKEGKIYFSSKHKLYGYKVELSVRPNRVASAFSKHYPGSKSDYAIMQERIEDHKLRLENREKDEGLDDDFSISEKYKDYWGVLMDKG